MISVALISRIRLQTTSTMEMQRKAKMDFGLISWARFMFLLRVFFRIPFESVESRDYFASGLGQVPYYRI